MMRAPVTLGIDSEYGTCGSDRTQKNGQLSVAQEIIGGFGETRKKAAGMLVQITVKSHYRVHVQELVKEPATSSPLASVPHQGEIPRGYIHA